MKGRWSEWHFTIHRLLWCRNAVDRTRKCIVKLLKIKPQKLMYSLPSFSFTKHTLCIHHTLLRVHYTSCTQVIFQLKIIFGWKMRWHLWHTIYKTLRWIFRTSFFHFNVWSFQSKNTWKPKYIENSMKRAHVHLPCNVSDIVPYRCVIHLQFKLQHTDRGNLTVCTLTSTLHGYLTITTNALIFVCINPLFVGFE